MPDKKLMELLEIAMSSDTAATIKNSRELMDSGIDPINLMSQLAGLIVDMIAGTYSFDNSNGGGTATVGQRCECFRQIISFLCLPLTETTCSHLLFLSQRLLL